MTAASVALGVIAFMNAAFGLRFLPAAFFAFFFAIFCSPLNESMCCFVWFLFPDFLRPPSSGDVKMPISVWHVNDFQREIGVSPFASCFLTKHFKSAAA